MSVRHLNARHFNDEGKGPSQLTDAIAYFGKRAPEPMHPQLSPVGIWIPTDGSRVAVVVFAEPDSNLFPGNYQLTKMFDVGEVVTSILFEALAKDVVWRGKSTLFDTGQVGLVFVAKLSRVRIPEVIMPGSQDWANPSPVFSGFDSASG